MAKLARVSNPRNQDNKATAPKLIRYLLDNKHFSPFEMVHACVYFELPRDITRQMLRHGSFKFQEFSGRYAVYDDLNDYREGRLQDHKNRQNSLPMSSRVKRTAWNTLVKSVRVTCLAAYRTALDMGIAKEVARALLPEGLVPTRLYMVGSLRSWIHYWDVRCHEATQKEHREAAEQARELILAQFPQIKEALEKDSHT